MVHVIKNILIISGVKKISFLENIKNYLNFIETALKQNGLALVNYIIKEVKLYNDKAEIIFNTPIKKSPNNKDSSFLSINKSARKMITNKTTKSYIHLELDFCI